MQKEIKIFSSENDVFSVYFSIDSRKSGQYNYRFVFQNISFTVCYNKYRKDQIFVTDYLHQSLQKDGLLKEEKFAIKWVKNNFELGMKHIIKGEYGKITLV